MTDDIIGILAEAKRISQKYRAATGKPLGITGEVAEFEAARILGLELTPARQAGFDAIESGTGLHGYFRSRADACYPAASQDSGLAPSALRRNGTQC
jgi:hypothetical protein